MASVDELRVASNEVRLLCLEVVTEFAQRNPTVPAQSAMIGLGELLIQFSIAHAGVDQTIHLLDSLRDIVVHLGLNEELI